MIKDIIQTDSRFLKNIQESGCLFLCFAEVSTVEFNGETGIKILNNLWNVAKHNGYISKDDIILDHNAIANKIFQLNVKYDNIHHKASEDIPKEVKYVFGQYVYKYGHFVVLNKNKEVVFDSLGKSNTVKYGKLNTMRWYYAN